jgi:hypothetical protein|tara:strand:+ start:37 stop:504 length:468 start_codon:yes stop_codon:yes gene_type:complete
MPKKRKGRPPKKLDPDRVVQRAVQLATGDVGMDYTGMPEKVKGEELTTSMNKFLMARTGMFANEFYERVTSKLEHLVDSLADDLQERYKDMPPQNLAYALGIVVDKVNNLKGRPQSMTANVNVGFGPKERSREDILRILGNGDAKEVEAEKVEEA